MIKTITLIWRRPVSTLVVVSLTAIGIFVAAQKSGFDFVSKTNINMLKEKGGVVLASWGIEIPSPLESASKSSSISVSDHPAESKKAAKHESNTHEKTKHEDASAEGGHHLQHRIVVTTPKVMDLKIVQSYVCQIRSRRHIDVCALEKGYLEEIHVKEGQAVRKGDLMFRILPTLYQAKQLHENLGGQKCCLTK